MPRIRGKGLHGHPTFDQAEKIIRKFSGESRFARIVGISRITAYRWQYAKPYGTDGLVPANHVDHINRMAREQGILLMPTDWSPSRIKYGALPDTEDVFNTKTLEDLLS